MAPTCRALRFAADIDTIGAIFFAANILAGISVLLAARIAARFGLINTMVFTHIPSNVLLMLVPLAPRLRKPEMAQEAEGGMSGRELWHAVSHSGLFFVYMACMTFSIMTVLAIFFVPLFFVLVRRRFPLKERPQ